MVENKMEKTELSKEPNEFWTNYIMGRLKDEGMKFRFWPFGIGSDYICWDNVDDYKEGSISFNKEINQCENCWRNVNKSSLLTNFLKENIYIGIRKENDDLEHFNINILKDNLGEIKLDNDFLGSVLNKFKKYFNYENKIKYPMKKIAVDVINYGKYLIECGYHSNKTEDKKENENSPRLEQRI